MAVVVGSAVVRIRADTTGLARDLERQLGRMESVGGGIGQSIGKSIRNGITLGLGDPSGLIEYPPVAEAAAAGMAAGRAWGQGFRHGANPHIMQMMNQLGPPAGRALAAGINSGVDQNLDISAPIEKEIEQGAKNAEPAVAKAIDSGASKGAKQGGKAVETELNKSAKSSGDSFGKIFSDSFSLGGKPAPFEKQIIQMTQGITQMSIMGGLMGVLAATAASAAQGVLALGAAFAAAVPAAAKFANVLGSVIQGLVVTTSLFGGVGDAISSYSDYQDEAASATNNTTDALHDEEQRLHSIEMAQDAYNDAVIEGARANEDAAERVSDAEEALSDAEQAVLDAEEAVRDATEAVSDAEEGLSDAIEAVSDAEEALSDAMEAVTDAEEELSDAQRDQQQAQEDLTQARTDAIEELEDMELALSRAALTEEEAMLELAKAEKALAEARASGNANAIYEADLAYRKALQNLAEVQEANNDLYQEAQKMHQEGVDGNAEVLAAQEALTDAIEASADAMEGLTDAIEGVSDAQEGLSDSSEGVSDAQEALSDAMEGVAKAQEGVSDSLEAVADAQTELARALEDVSRVAVDSALAIESAELALAAAMNASTPAIAANDAALQSLNESFAEISPAAQDFVKFWVDEFLPAFEDIQFEGQEIFFPKLIEAMEMFLVVSEDHLDMLEVLEEAYKGTATVMGDFAISMAEVLTSAEGLEDINTMLQDNVEILGNLTSAVAIATPALLTFFSATSEYAVIWSQSVEDAATQFANFMEEVSQPLPELGGESQLDVFLENVNRIAGKIWDLITNLGDAFVQMVQVAAPAGEWLIDQMIKATDKWATNIEQNSAQITENFQASAEVLWEILEVVGLIATEISSWAQTEGLAEMIDTLGGTVQKGLDAFQAAFENLVIPITSVVEALGLFFELAANSKVVEGFVWAIGLMAEGFTLVAEAIRALPGEGKLVGLLSFAYGIYKAGTLIKGLGGNFAKRITEMGEAMGGLANRFFDLTGIDFQFKFGKLGDADKAGDAAKAFDAGSDIAENYERGIESGKDEVRRAADEVQDAAGTALKTGSADDGRDAGDNMMDSFRNQIAAGTATTVAAAEGAQQAVGAALKTGAARDGRDAGDEMMDAFRNQITTGTAGVVAAAEGAQQAVGAAIKTGAERDGRAAGDDMMDAFRNQITTGAPGVVTAAEGAQQLVGTAIKSGAGRDGREAGDDMMDGYRNQITAGTPIVVAAAETAQQTVGAALKTGADRDGRAAGDETMDAYRNQLVFHTPTLVAAAETVQQSVGAALKTGADRDGRAAGDETMDAYRNQLVFHTPALVAVAETTQQTVGTALKTGADRDGRAAGDETMDAYRNQIVTHTPTLAAAAETAQQTVGAALKSGASRDGKAAGDEMMDGFRNQIGAGTPGVVAAAETAQQTVGAAIKSGAAVDGRAAGDEMMDAFRNAITTGTAGAVTAAETAQRTVGNAMKSGATTDGKQAGDNMVDGMVDSLDRASAVGGELERAGRDAAKAVQRGADSVNVTVDVDTRGPGGTQSGGTGGGDGTPGKTGEGGGTAEGGTPNQGGGGETNTGGDRIDIGGEGGVDIELGDGDINIDAGDGGLLKKIGGGLIALIPGPWLTLLKGLGVALGGAGLLNAITGGEGIGGGGGLFGGGGSSLEEALASWVEFCQGVAEEWGATAAFLVGSLGGIGIANAALISQLLPMWEEHFGAIENGWVLLWQRMGSATSQFPLVIAGWWQTNVDPMYETFWDNIEHGWVLLWQRMGQTGRQFPLLIGSWWATNVDPMYETFWDNIEHGWFFMWQRMGQTGRQFPLLIGGWWKANIDPMYAEFWANIENGWIVMWRRMQSTAKEFPTILAVAFQQQAAPVWRNGWGGIFKGWMGLWDDTARESKRRWDTGMAPWLDSRDDDVNMRLAGLFMAMPREEDLGIVKTKAVWDSDMSPWLKSRITEMENTILKFWVNLPTEAKEEFRAQHTEAANVMNKYTIEGINSMPFAEDVKNWPTFAKGGEVKGPRGPIDNVAARLTPGEYVLTRKMVKDFGLGALERWRKGGLGGKSLPRPRISSLGRGGAAKTVSSDALERLLRMLVGNATKQTKVEVVLPKGGLGLDFGDIAFREGHARATRDAFEATAKEFPKVWTSEDFTSWMNTDSRNPEMDKWGKRQDDKMFEKMSSSEGGDVPPYTGPPGGWTYPLTKKYNSYTFPGHNPPNAYDIGSPTGVGVVAVSSGKVVTSANKGSSSYGQYLKISHADGTYSLYAHLSERVVKVGQQVKTGQKIGVSGATGGVTGPHLHFELNPSSDTKSAMKKRGVSLASGGTVIPATPGGVAAILAEGGRAERVTPLNREGMSAAEVEIIELLRALRDEGGKGGDTYQVFPAPGMNETELARKVSREIHFKGRRRAT